MIAVLLQSLSLRIGIITGRDLAQLCKRAFHPAISVVLWVISELAIMATDLAEVIGTAIAFDLLFGLPIYWGVVLTSLDVLLILAGWNRHHLRMYEALIFCLILIIGICFSILISKANPDWIAVLEGYLPSGILVTDPDALYIGLGILGAIVMPHNLFLHSSLVGLKVEDKVGYVYTERFIEKGNGRMIEAVDWVKEKVMMVFRGAKKKDEEVVAGTLGAIGKSNTADTLVAEHDEPDPTSPTSSATTTAIPWILRPYSMKSTITHALQNANIDSAISLTYALVVNSFILIVSGSAFYNPTEPLATIKDAHGLLKRDLGAVAATLFAVALFFSGQCSTITGTLAGQVVMEGFLADPKGEDTVRGGWYG
jgi:Mn2+/Fe2+ NRAMP family transporter